MSKQAKFYRDQAQRNRELAERVHDADIKAHLLQVAEQYDKLAAEADSPGE